MAIAGIEPVDYAYWLVNNTEYYDREKVRKILERYDEWIQYVGNDDVNGFMEIGEE